MKPNFYSAYLNRGVTIFKLKDKGITEIEFNLSEALANFNYVLEKYPNNIYAKKNKEITENILNEYDKNKLPKWFKGEIYNKGAKVTSLLMAKIINWTQMSYMYDFIIGASFYTGNESVYNKVLSNEIFNGLKWFRHKNPEAYMVYLMNLI